jgi:hypothetical protein
MWEALQKKFKANDNDYMIGLINDFVMCCMENLKEDPEDWIDRMEIMSSEMAALDAKYEKSNHEIIAHVFAPLPKIYKGPIDTFCNNGKNNMLESVKKGLHTKWKSKFGIKSKSFKKEEDGGKEALNAEGKQEKGDCQECGKKGRKAADCWVKKGGKDQAKNKAAPSDHKLHKCYQCNRMGHLNVRCPDKDQEIGLMMVFCTEVGTKSEVPSMIELMEELEIDQDLVIVGQSINLDKTNFESRYL